MFCPGRIPIPSLRLPPGRIERSRFIQHWQVRLSLGHVIKRAPRTSHPQHKPKRSYLHD
jgi:hypothetical protein